MIDRRQRVAFSQLHPSLAQDDIGSLRWGVDPLVRKPSKVMASDVVRINSAETVNGKSLKIKTLGGSVMIGGAKVVKTDIECSNGVIHVIDSVILPN